VIAASYAAIAFGTMFGGWRIVKTMGTRITKLQPYGGFCAETAGAITILGATAFGIPVSTTHTITGAIVGVGTTKRFLGREVGRRRPDRLGVDPDDPPVGRGRSPGLSDHQSGGLTSASARLPHGEGGLYSAAHRARPGEPDASTDK